MPSTRNLAYRKQGSKEELEVAGPIPRNGDVKAKPFGHLLERVPNHPEADHDYLVERATAHASLRERGIETTSVLRIIAIDGKIVEMEVRLYDQERNLRAIACWKADEHLHLTRVD